MRFRGLVALTTVLCAASAHADDSSITVWLTNGSIVRGEIVERVPDDHLTIKLATGEVRRIEWKEIDHDSLAAKKPAPKPDPEPSEVEEAHKPSAKAKAVSDYVPPDVSSSSGAGGLVVSGADGYFVQRLTGTFSGYGRATGGGSVVVSGEAWTTECVAPCNQPVAPGTYRIDGDGIPTSSSFTLRGYERVQVSPGNSAGYYGGRLLTAAGLGFLLVGAITHGAKLEDSSDTATTMMIGGAIGLAVGIPIWLLSRTTVEVKGSSGIAVRPNGFAF